MAGCQDLAELSGVTGMLHNAERVVLAYHVQHHNAQSGVSPGFWKSPAGTNALSGQATFPKLFVYGASLRGHIFRGIANVELGYYDSREDSDGDDRRLGFAPVSPGLFTKKGPM